MKKVRKTLLLVFISALISTTIGSPALGLSSTNHEETSPGKEALVREKGRTKQKIHENVCEETSVLSSKVDHISDDEITSLTGEAREDGLRIDIVYEIGSTTDISDAYLSGDRSGLDEHELAILEMAEAVIDEVIIEGMTDVEKEFAIYGWLCHIPNAPEGYAVIIDPEDDTYTPYGVLSDREAVCVGYATTFRLFMQMLKIPCKVVCNSSMTHSWNMVQLEGEWYHVDSYQDALDPRPTWRLNLTDTMMEEWDLDWDRDLYPAAECEKYYYSGPALS